MIRTKSVHSPIEPEDGLRILATRFRGRGLPSSHYDVWMANLGSSEELLAAVQSGQISWAEFGKRYRAEMMESASTDRANRTIKNHGQKFTLRLLQELGRRENITILCHCPEHARGCHRHILAKMLAGRIG